MHNLKVLTTAVALVFVTPVLARRWAEAPVRAAQVDTSPLIITVTTSAPVKEATAGSEAVRSMATTHTP
jgi:hypothetical protein